MSRTPEVAEHAIALRVAVLVALVAAGSATLQQGVGGSAARAVVLVGYPVSFLVAYLTRNHRPAVLRLIIGSGRRRGAGDVGRVAGSPVVGQLRAAAAAPGRGLHLAAAGPGVRLARPASAAGHAALDRGPDRPRRRALALDGDRSVAVDLGGRLGRRARARSAGGARPSSEPRAPRRGAPVPRSAWRVRSLRYCSSLLVVGSAVFMVAPVAGTNRALTFPSSLPRPLRFRPPGRLTNPTLGSSDPSLRPGRAKSRDARVVRVLRVLETTRHRHTRSARRHARDAGPGVGSRLLAGTDLRRLGRAGVDRLRRPARSPPRRSATGIPRRSGRRSRRGLDRREHRQAGADLLPPAGRAQRDLRRQPGDPGVLPRSQVFQTPGRHDARGRQPRPGHRVHRREPAPARHCRQILRAVRSDPVPADIALQYATRPVATDRVARPGGHRIRPPRRPTTRSRPSRSGSGRTPKYTLDIPRLPPGADAVDRFLFVDRRGFCEQIGTSSSSCCARSASPHASRSGYAPGERNPFTGLYEVKASDAHAWAEVYFPGVGWQAFDPTAHVPLAGDSRIDSAGTGAFTYLSPRLDVPSRAPGGARGAGARLASVAPRVVVVRRRRRRDRVEPWASQRLAALELLGARRGRARAPSETTPTTCAPSTATDPAAAGSCARRHDRRGDVRARTVGRRATRAWTPRSPSSTDDGPTRRTPALAPVLVGPEPTQATGTPSKIATFTPRRDELGEERPGHHDPPEPEHTRARCEQAREAHRPGPPS